MTIEQKCNELIDQINLCLTEKYKSNNNYKYMTNYIGCSIIENWSFLHLVEKFRITPHEYWRYNFILGPKKDPVTKIVIYVCTEINKLIKNADLTECLTSRSEYIRECKKWFMENEK